MVLRIWSRDSAVISSHVLAVLSLLSEHGTSHVVKAPGLCVVLISTMSGESRNLVSHIYWSCIYQRDKKTKQINK